MGYTPREADKTATTRLTGDAVLNRLGKRAFTSPYLSDMLPDRPKLFVECEKCGMKKRYDVAAMLEKIEDTCLPELLRVLAKAEGCEKAHKGNFNDQCYLRYGEQSRMETRR